MFHELSAALQHVDAQLTAEEIADALWLANFMPASDSNATGPTENDQKDVISELPADAGDAKPARQQAAPEQDAPEPERGNLYLRTGSGDDFQRGSLFRSPAAFALPNPLGLGRALRPFKRRVPSRTVFTLNEEETARRIAETKLWLPVLDAASTRWLEVALVIDEASSMAIWRQTILELRLLLEREGAFRTVRTWGLVTDAADGKAHLYAGTAREGRRECNPHELIDPGGRRLILVVTDGVSPAWDKKDGSVAAMLASWGRSTPVTIVQVLPQRLWRRTTALRAAVQVRLHALTPGPPNQQLAARPVYHWDAEEASTGIKVPVVTLESRSLLNWARAIARAEDIWIPGYVFNPNTAQDNGNPDPPAQTQSKAAPLSAEERVNRFRASASPTAYKLAGLLSTVPVSLPIIRLLQQTMLPQSLQMHAAEVLLGGLLKEVLPVQAGDNPDYIEYEFIDGVRELLFDSLKVNEAVETIEILSNFIEKRLGQSSDFLAALPNPYGTETLPINKEARRFARIAASVLHKLGGSYAQLAESYEKVADEIDGQVPEPPIVDIKSPGVSQDQNKIGEQVSEQSADQVQNNQLGTTEKIEESAVSETDSQIHTHEQEEIDNTAPNSEQVTRKDFFISYHTSDADWATWVARQLENAKYSIEMQVWDFQSGADFVKEIDTILGLAKRLIVILSPAYLDALSFMPSWVDAFLNYPENGPDFIVALHVRECRERLNRLLGSIAYTNFVGLNEQGARSALSMAIDNMPDHTSIAGARLLWVDDHPENNVYPRREIEALGIQITLSRSTEDALEKVYSNTYDVIISDMGRQPPDPQAPYDTRAGYKLLDTLRSRNILTPFIIYAGSSSRKHQAETRRHGGFGTTNNAQVLRQMVIDAIAQFITSTSSSQQTMQTFSQEFFPSEWKAPVKADIAIITALEDEFGAMFVRLEQYQLELFTGPSGRTYAISSVPTRSNKICTVALARCSEQGNDVSQQVAADMIRDFDPQLLLVTGIAGGTPHYEFTLGDVIVSSHIHNFNLSASNQRVLAFDVKGDIHPYVSNITANLPLYKNELAGWNEPDSIGMERPVVDLAWVQANLYGNEKWRIDVLNSFSKQFGEPASQARLPLFKTGSIASSNTLMKDTWIPTQWLETARSILAVEMESVGVLQAAQQIEKQYPVMAIRAISDIIGLKRDERWTPYACQSAAAFTCAFIKAGIVAPREQPSDPPASEETTSGTKQGSKGTNPGTPVDPPANPPKNGEPAPLNLFISYAASDERFKRELDNHLVLLRRSNTIRSYEMEAGQEWRKETSERIGQSQIILLLISTDFLNSNDLYDNELQQAMSRHRAGAARVIPILIRPASTEGTPFSRLLPLPRNRQPVALWRNHDEAWVEIVQEIRRVCQTLREGQKQQ